MLYLSPLCCLLLPEPNVETGSDGGFINEDVQVVSAAPPPSSVPPVGWQEENLLKPSSGQSMSRIRSEGPGGDTARYSTVGVLRNNRQFCKVRCAIAFLRA